VTCQSQTESMKIEEVHLLIMTST